MYLLDEILLLRYLHVFDFDHESARKLLIENLEFREKNASLFFDRDVDDPKIQNIMKSV